MTQKLLLTLIFLILCTGQFVNTLHLKKVVVFSRHNVRAPLSEVLDKLTPKKWPKWNVEHGFLTQRGALLESYMGEYFAKWLQEKDLLSTTECPQDKYVYVYANSFQRTIETAKSFIRGAFPECNIVVNYNTSSYSKMDRPFQFHVTNDTEAFKLEGERQMREKLSNTDLQDVYIKLNEIADVKDSEVCKTDGICDLTKDKDMILFNAGSAPAIAGRIKVATSMVDSFLMSYYEGFPLQDVAWGHIRSEDHWNLLSKILNAEQNVRFNFTEYLIKRTGKYLINYLKQAMEDNRKLTFLAGHDANIRTILVALGFKSFVLPEQFELTPVGGKLVFQKWSNGEKDFMKIEYVYQSTKQIREAQKLSLENPPKSMTMYLKVCSANEAGMCTWTVFQTILNNFIK